MSGEETQPLAMTGSEVPEEAFYALGEDSPYEYLDGKPVLSFTSRRQQEMFIFLLTLLSF